MASKQNIADYLVDQLGVGGNVTAKKMFGEYGLYLDGKMFAIVADDQLFIKPTEAARTLLPAPVEAAPYPGAKAYWLIDAEQWERQEWLAQLAQTTANALPLPVKKLKKTKPA
jgi:TfoX/Sxy family transcriptional regulator of competence genes